MLLKLKSIDFLNVTKTAARKDFKTGNLTRKYQLPADPWSTPLTEAFKH